MATDLLSVKRAHCKPLVLALNENPLLHVPTMLIKRIEKYRGSSMTPMFFFCLNDGSKYNAHMVMKILLTWVFFLSQQKGIF